MPLSNLIHILYPVQCSVCSISLPDQTFPLCPTCLSQIEAPPPEIVTNYFQLQEIQSIPIQAVYAHWYFDNRGSVQKLHQQLKYGNSPYHGAVLGSMIGFGLRRSGLLKSNPDFIIPIPLHKKRFLERGYNQSEALAEGISQVLDIPVEKEGLKRSRSTRSQTGLNRRERKTNLHEAFEVLDVNSINGTHILVIDDVLTTGATLLSASQALYNAGARTISLSTLAFTRS